MQLFCKVLLCHAKLLAELLDSGHSLPPFLTLETFLWVCYTFHKDNFVNLQKRDALSAALLQLQLYAPPVIDQAAQQMYCLLLDWGENPQNDALHIDKKLQRIQADMRADLDFFRREGHH